MIPRFNVTQEALFTGPSPLCNEPVLVLRLRLELDGDPGQLDQLLALVDDEFPEAPPSLLQNGETPAATRLADAALRISLDLLNSDWGVIEARGLRTNADGSVLLWLGYHAWELSLKAFLLSLEFLCHLAEKRTPPREQPDLAAKIRTLHHHCRMQHPDYIARTLICGARARGLPWMPSAAGLPFWQFGQGKASVIHQEASPDHESIFGRQIANDKVRTHHLLKALGLPVPNQFIVGNLQEAQLAAERLGWPVVVKPSDSGQGRGVTAGVLNRDHLARAFESARSIRHSGAIIVEQFLQGTDYRLLVIRGKLVSAIRREPACVTGDGTSTIQELVTTLNRARRIERRTNRYLKYVEIDGPVLDHLSSQGLSPDSIPEAGKKLSLRSNANISTGGTGKEVLALVHPEVRELAELIATNLGLASLGVDYITEDLSRSWRNGGGAVIEVNSTPGINIHATEGVSEAQIGSLVLGNHPGRIPSLLLVDEEPGLRKALDTWLGPLAKSRGSGYAGPLGPLLDGATLATEPIPLHAQVRMLVRNKGCERLLIACTITELTSQGCPLDRLDRCLLGPGVQVPKAWLRLLQQLTQGPLEQLSPTGPDPDSGA